MTATLRPRRRPHAPTERYVLRHVDRDHVGRHAAVTGHASIDDAHARADRLVRTTTAARWRQLLVDTETGDRWSRLAGEGWLLDDLVGR